VIPLDIFSTISLKKMEMAEDIAKSIPGLCFLKVSHNIDNFEQRLEQQYNFFLYFVNFQNQS